MLRRSGAGQQSLQSVLGEEESLGRGGLVKRLGLSDAMMNSRGFGSACCVFGYQRRFRTAGQSIANRTPFYN